MSDNLTIQNSEILEQLQAYTDKAYILLDNDNNIILINNHTKKILGLNLNYENNGKFILPYSINKEFSINLKINPKKYKTIHYDSQKITINKKNYTLILFHEKKKNQSVIENSIHNLFENSYNVITYFFDFEEPINNRYNHNFTKLYLSNRHYENKEIKDFLNIMPKEYNELIERVINQKYDNPLETKNIEEQILVKKIISNSIYWIVDNIIIELNNKKIKKIKGLGLIINKSIEEYDRISDNKLIIDSIGNKLSSGVYCINLIDNKIKTTEKLSKLISNYEILSNDPQKIKVFVHPDDYETVSYNLEQLNNRKASSITLNYRLKINNNEWKWYENKLSVLNYDETGKPSKILGILNDISTQKSNLEELNYYKNYFEQILEKVPLVIFITDSKGKIKFINKYNEKLTGYSNKEFIGKYVYDTLTKVMEKDELNNLNYEEFKSLVMDTLRNVIDRKEVLNHITKHKDIHNNEFILKSSYYPILHNECTELLAICQDITTLNILEEEIKSNYEQTNDILSNISQPIIIFDSTNLKILFSNSSANKLFNSDTITTNFLNFIENDNTLKSRLKLKENIYNYEIYIKTDDKKFIKYKLDSISLNLENINVSLIVFNN